VTAGLLGFACASATLACGCARGDVPPYVGFVDEPVSAVATQVAGKVESMPVREGGHVRKGDLVAQLEASTYEAALVEAQANVERAKLAIKEAQAGFAAALPTVTGATADIARARATRDEADVELARVERLFRSGSLAQSEVDAARARALEARAALESMMAARSQTHGRVGVASAAIDSSRASLAASEAALRLADAQLAQTRITSPFDGIVVSLNLHEGEWAAPGTPIVTVEDTSHPWVRLDVPETAFRTLRLDQGADIRVLALPGRTFHARVAEIGAEGDFAIDRDVKRGRPDIRTFLVRVTFDTPPGELRPGLTAEVRLLDETLPPARPEARR
jgi:multidrug resistance efflux pump